jgi:hypothetical protein
MRRGGPMGWGIHGERIRRASSPLEPLNPVGTRSTASPSKATWRNSSAAAGCPVNASGRRQDGRTHQPRYHDRVRTRLRANNLRCLLALEARFDSFGVRCGPHEAGKSSVFDAPGLSRNRATGDRYLGGEGERDLQCLEFTHGQKGSAQPSTIQPYLCNCLGTTRGTRVVVAGSATTSRPTLSSH